MLAVGSLLSILCVVGSFVKDHLLSAATAGVRSFLLSIVIEDQRCSFW